jgi:predicted nuclease of predicted toxin-antitoxin system
VRFLIDTQLPRSLGKLLEAEGHQIEHGLDLNEGKSSDNELWKRALDPAAIIITKDEDFATWVFSGRTGPSVIWLRIGNCSKATLAAWFMPLLPEALRKLEEGERLVELQRKSE